MNVITNRLKGNDASVFEKLREDYKNLKLEEFVTGGSIENKNIIEYKGKLVRKYKPIFMDPEGSFIKAHFYAPRKQIFGVYVDTFVVNVIFLWIMTGLFYLALYFRLLKKLLDSGEIIIGKAGKGSD